MASAESDAGLELAMRKLTQTPGVSQFVILNNTGIPVHKYGMEDPKSIEFAGLFSELRMCGEQFLVTQSARFLDPQSEEAPELVTLRLRTKKSEYVVCPGESYTLIVVHSPNYEEPEEETEEAAGEGEDGEEGAEGAGAPPGSARP